MLRPLAMAWMTTMFVISTTVAFAQDADPQPADEHRVLVSKLAEQVAGRCTVHVGRDEQALVLHPRSLLSWSNPTVGEVYGEVFVWTHHGRPKCLASVYRWFAPDWGATLEICSLTAEPLSGRDQERAFWKAAAPLAWQTLSDAELPADSATARLVQLRRVAGRFSVRLQDTRHAQNAVPRRLRLMARPFSAIPRRRSILTTWMAPYSRMSREPIPNCCSWWNVRSRRVWGSGSAPSCESTAIAWTLWKETALSGPPTILNSRTSSIRQRHPMHC